jgi:hypothetical protein
LHLADFLDQVNRIEGHVPEIGRRRNVGREVGSDHINDCVAIASFIERPLQGVLRALGAFDTDDDSM